MQADALKQAGELHAELDKVNADRTRLQSLIVKMEANYEARDRLTLLRNRVHSKIYESLTDDIISRFGPVDAQAMFVMSVDIRRSTELMLKAKTPHGFASFLTGLCADLGSIVLDHYGVVDKFTGDGILCYFPPFIAGQAAGLNAVAAANRCHEAFTRHYDKSRSLFEVVPLDLGLGIGIDYGYCHFVEVGSALTVVGRPVVYACRFAGGEAGTTLLNQSARDAVFQGYPNDVRLIETSIGIKHESRSVAYSAQMVNSQYVPGAPEWLTAVHATPSDEVPAVVPSSDPAQGMSGA